MEISLYMVKPEAMPHRNRIRRHIGRNLLLGESKILHLTNEAIDEIYDDLDDGLRHATRIALKGPVELGLVSGESAIDSLLKLAGENTAPADCSPDSIRYQFGVHEPLTIEGSRYFLNAIHRPKTVAEAAAHVSLFQRL